MIGLTLTASSELNFRPPPSHQTSANRLASLSTVQNRGVLGLGVFAFCCYTNSQKSLLGSLLAHMKGSYMTIYGHLELNTDQHKHPNTSYNAYTCCTKLVQAFGGQWGAMGLQTPICHGGWSGVTWRTHAVPSMYWCLYPPIAPHRPPYTTKHLYKIPTACIGVI